MRHFQLVQRLEQLPVRQETATTSPIREATDRMVASGMGTVNTMNSDLDPITRADLGFDYMGAAEFEFGAVPSSARNIISKISRLTVVSETLVRPSYEEPVHFVCTQEQAETVLPAWHEWTQDPRTREMPNYFKDSKIDYVFESSRIIAWWALNENLLWTQDLVLATKLKEGFTQRKRELFEQQSLPRRVIARLGGVAPKF